MSDEMKLVIGIPTTGMVATGFAYSLAGLVSYLAGKGLPSRPEATVTCSIDVQESSVIHTNREQIVSRAIKDGKTHLLFLDHDMVFEPNILDVLAGRRHEIVVTNYLVKSETERRWVAVDLAGERIPTTAESTGLVPISYSGFGVSLFDLNVFKRTPQPWFLPIFRPEQNTYTTEDNPCFARLREEGATVYLDQDASKLVTGHVGLAAWSWRK